MRRILSMSDHQDRKAIWVRVVSSEVSCDVAHWAVLPHERMLGVIVAGSCFDRVSTGRAPFKHWVACQGGVTGVLDVSESTNGVAGAACLNERDPDRCRSWNLVCASRVSEPLKNRQACTDAACGPYPSVVLRTIYREPGASMKYLRPLIPLSLGLYEWSWRCREVTITRRDDVA